MTNVALQGVRGWASTARQLASSPRAPALVGCLLALLGVAELAVRGAAGGGQSLQPFGSTSSAVSSAAHAVPAGPHVVPDHGISLVALFALFLVCLATTLPLAFLPRAAAAVAAGAASLLSLTAFGVLTVASMVALLFALYRLGHGGSRVLAPVLAAPFVLLAIGWLAAGAPGPGPGARVTLVLLASLAPVAALAGIARQARGEAAAHGVARQVISGALLEHTARGERARIARELHDVVAHHISMIAVQAESARLATPGMPEAGARRLSDIGDTARAALTEMRRLLGVLREDAGPGEPAAGRHPQPGLRELNELLDAAREASGTGARLILHGPPSALDPGVELAAYRIIQEALTNARRHAPGAAVDVELHYGDDALRLRVRDNGPGPPASLTGGHALPDGHGLAGMRERAVAVGGELRTGPAPGGGFLVEAALPVKEEPT
jgi:signal transduction histidine kinase